jgi:uncharacterized C2H2 Zn-finger protein
MLYGERIAVCAEIHTNHVNKAGLYYRFRPYLAVNTHRHGFKDQSFYAVWGKIAVFSEIHTKHVNKAESYHRLRSYRAENAVLCIYVS